MPECLAGKRVSEAVTRAFALLDDLFELSAGELRYRPAYDGAWCVLEHLEHVALANHFLLLTIRKGCRIALRRAAAGQRGEGESDLDLLDPIAVPGAFEWPPPPHMLPTGQREYHELRRELREQLHDCLELVASMPAGEGRLYSIRMSVNRLGRLDMYQWIYFLAQHASYHVAFIDKIREGERTN